MSAITGRELIRMFGPDNLGRPSGEDFYTTSQSIANLAGGLGGGVPTILKTGTSYVTNPEVDTFVCWQTVATGSKTTTIDTDGMIDGQTLVVKDYGAADYPNTLQPLDDGVTIEFESSYVMDSANGESVNLKWDAVNSNLMVF